MKTLEFTFQNSLGKTVRMSLNDPVEPVDTTAVNAVMDAAIAKNIFELSGGELTAKLGARLIERNVTDITL